MPDNLPRTASAGAGCTAVDTGREIHLFACAVQSLGYRVNIGTGKVVPLPPDADETVARYRHDPTGRTVCVWQVCTEQAAHQVGVIADRHGLRLMGYGRPAPAGEPQGSAIIAPGSRNDALSADRPHRSERDVRLRRLRTVAADCQARADTLRIAGYHDRASHQQGRADDIRWAIEQLEQTR
jgi:hypothetical protein